MIEREELVKARDDADKAWIDADEARDAAYKAWYSTYRAWDDADKARYATGKTRDAAGRALKAYDAKHPGEPKENIKENIPEIKDRSDSIEFDDGMD